MVPDTTSQPVLYGRLCLLDLMVFAAIVRLYNDLNFVDHLRSQVQFLKLIQF